MSNSLQIINEIADRMDAEITRWRKIETLLKENPEVAKQIPGLVELIPTIKHAA